MKKILTLLIMSALLLTACGQMNNRRITEIEMHETGGEDGRANTWRFFINEAGEKMLVFEDRFDETKIYILSDDDYAEISDINFSRYIGKKDNTDGVYDALYYNIIIRYDDGTEEKSEKYIPDLFKKFNYFVYECSPSYDSENNDTE